MSLLVNGIPREQPVSSPSFTRCSAVKSSVFHLPFWYGVFNVNNSVSFTRFTRYSMWTARWIFYTPIRLQGLPYEWLGVFHTLHKVFHVNRSVFPIPSTWYSTWATRCPPLPPQGVPRELLAVVHILHKLFSENRSASSTPSTWYSTWATRCPPQGVPRQQLGVFHILHMVFNVNNSVSSTPHSPCRVLHLNS